MTDTPDLKLGDSGEWVEYLQQLMTTKGFWFNGQTGSFNEELDEAVKNFQGAAGLFVDGWVGPETWTALAAVTDLVEHEVDFPWTEYTPELFSLATAVDFDAFVSDRVGVDPDLVKGLDGCAEAYANVVDAQLGEHLRLFAGSTPVMLSELHATIDWIDWAAVGMVDLGDRLEEAGYPTEGTRFRMHGGIFEVELERVRTYR